MPLAAALQDEIAELRRRLGVSAHQIVQLKAEAAEGDAALMREKYNHSKVGGTGATHACAPGGAAKPGAAAALADAGGMVSCVLRGGSSVACKHTGAEEADESARGAACLPLSRLAACLPVCCS